MCRIELDVQDTEGQTPLHAAVEKKQESSCSLLLDMGANPNIVNGAMLAPIHLAISKEYNHIVQVGFPHTHIVNWYR